MPKEKNYNPVQAQRKADKAREIKKGKAEAKGRRDEKLARKNPDRLQKQIDDLKTVASTGGKLTRHEEQVLSGLERELKAVQRARDALGDKAPTWRSAGSLGKRRRDESGSESDTPEDVRGIPMPRDTPPPIPKAEMDKWWAKRRAKRHAETTKAEEEEEAKEAKEEKEIRESKTVYEAKPIVRDLRGEAVAAFVPTSVQMKMSKGKGEGGLMEPEEADRLEREGYLKAEGEASRRVTVEDAEDEA